MILKFEEFINEGLWSKGIERSKTGKAREGDIPEVIRQLKDIEWVDLGHKKYLFAKTSFPDEPKNLQELLSAYDIGEILKFLPEDIDVLSNKEVRWLRDNTIINRYSYPDSNGRGLVFSTKKQSMYMNGNVYYFLKHFTTDKATIEKHADIYVVPFVSSSTPFTSYRATVGPGNDENENYKKCYCLKLVKLKK